MATAQPVILTCLKVCRLCYRSGWLKAILLIILEKFHQLDLAILAAQTRARLSEAKKLLVPLHLHAASRSTDLIHAADYAKDFGAYFVSLASSMATPSNTQDVKKKLSKVSASALLTAREFREGERNMKKVNQEIEPTVRQVTAVLNKASIDASSLVFTPENLQAVNELLQVTQEYTTIHAEISQYFEEMEKNFDPLTFQMGEPSDEEILMVQERWREFLQTLTNLQGDLRGIQTKIDIGPKAADALRLAEEMAVKNNLTNHSNTVTSRKAITDSSRAGPSSPRRPIRACLQAFSRRVLSCISLKHFD